MKKQEQILRSWFLYVRKLASISITFFVYSTLFLKCTQRKEQPRDKNLIDISFYLYDIKQAVETLRKDRKLINKVLSSHVNRREILAIGFPEVIRWNGFQDAIEIMFDKSVYVNYGIGQADFSIGLFQMKPSFVEHLEHYLESYPLVIPNSVAKDIVLRNKEEKDDRRVRIQRLSSTEWQLKYLSVYWYVANHKFKNITFQNNAQRLKFYATAYNFGFTRPISQIKNWQTKPLFPYGKNYKKEQVAYSDISVHFFNLHSPTFFTN